MVFFSVYPFHYSILCQHWLFYLVNSCKLFTFSIFSRKIFSFKNFFCKILTVFFCKSFSVMSCHAIWRNNLPDNYLADSGYHWLHCPVWPAVDGTPREALAAGIPTAGPRNRDCRMDQRSQRCGWARPELLRGSRVDSTIPLSEPKLRSSILSKCGAVALKAKINSKLS